ncbi:MAG: ABC transporter permease, partial [Dehalococcoidia bacterium]|nr:ABC transporter permease [Dehalococcoidia bacterium]
MLLRLLKETFWRRRQRVAVTVLAIVIGSALATALFAIYADIMDRMAQELRSYGANILVTPKSESLEISIGGTSYNPAQEPSYLEEDSLARLKTIFWRNNILGFAPSLTLAARVGQTGEPVAVTGTWFEKDVVIPKGTQIRSTFAQPTKAATDTTFRTGVKKVSPWWRLTEGKWPGEDARNEALLGQSLARRLGLRAGDSVQVGYGSMNRELRISGILTTGGPE